MTGDAWWVCAPLVAGSALVWSWLRARRFELEARVAPYVRPAAVDLWGERRERHGGGWSRLIAAALRDATRALERWGSPTAEVSARLARAGSPLTVEQFRAQQVAWGVVGLVAGLGFSVALLVGRGASVVVLLVLTLATALAGVAARDVVLGRAVAVRQVRVVSELPTIAELLALSVAAGEGAPRALERVCSSANGALSDELRAALADARSGVQLGRALQDMAVRADAPPLQRFADGVATAMELGTPLADVLRAQARDARASGREALMERGGKREIAMLVPVVFLILPVTILFAIYPGLAAIRLTG